MLHDSALYSGITKLYKFIIIIIIINFVAEKNAKYTELLLAL